jgi:hypothetical protein
MPRILIDLPEDSIKWLDARAAEQGKSRASVLREAVGAFKAQAGGNQDWIDQGCGLWKRHGIAIDPHEYEKQRRAEWTRPWDDDYDEVRAESPQYFTVEDDRERAHYLALAKKASAERGQDAT